VLLVIYLDSSCNKNLISIWCFQCKSRMDSTTML